MAGKQFAAPARRQLRWRAAADDAHHARVRAPEISYESSFSQCRITALRPMTDQLHSMRVTDAIFPATQILLSERDEMTITQFHVPVDDNPHLLVLVLHQFRRTALDKEGHASAAPAVHPPAGLRARLPGATNQLRNPEEQM